MDCYTRLNCNRSNRRVAVVEHESDTSKTTLTTTMPSRQWDDLVYTDQHHPELHRRSQLRLQSWTTRTLFQTPISIRIRRPPWPCRPSIHRRRRHPATGGNRSLPSASVWDASSRRGRPVDVVDRSPPSVLDCRTLPSPTQRSAA